MRILFVTLLFLSSVASIAQVQLDSIINIYGAIEEISFCDAKIIVPNAQDFQVGSDVILLQVKGATINASNNSQFGTVLSIGNAGGYEVNAIADIVNDTILLKYKLVNDYDVNGSVQIISFPEYESAVVSDTLTALAWDGTIGGVLAFKVNGTLTMNEVIDVSGKGFRGGIAQIDDENDCGFLNNANDYALSLNNWRGASKGEGVAEFLPGLEAGRGAQANGGGGGNDHNSGGGGGAYFADGGIGGVNDEPNLFGCNGNRPGIGGKALEQINGKIYFGGGGGAGHENNSVGTDGGTGGGIVIVIADRVVGVNNQIWANGVTAMFTSGDGAGGGGAGGTILTFVENVENSDTLFLNAQGGDGGNADNGQRNRCMGPGGGGSGGYVLHTVSDKTIINVNGGKSGLSINSTSCSDGPNEASGGQTGISVSTDQNLVEANQPITPLQITGPSQADYCQGRVVQVIMSIEGTPNSIQWELQDGGMFLPISDDNIFSGTNTSNLMITANNELDLSGRLIRLRLEDECGEISVSNPITLMLQESPLSGFSFSLEGLVANFQDESSLADSVIWNFGDGTTSILRNPTHDYQGAGAFLVQQITINECGRDTAFQEIVLGNLPTANFTLKSETGCAPLVVGYIDQSSGDVISWNWTFPGGTPERSSEPSLQVVYETPGIYGVQLIVGNETGFDTITLENGIEVLEAPVVDFMFELNGPQVLLTNLSDGAEQFEWDFGDGIKSTEENPVHEYTESGTYVITLMGVKGDCNTTINKEIDIVITSIVPDDRNNYVRIYPNPTFAQCFIELSSKTPYKEAWLVNSIGEVLSKFAVGGGVNQIEMDKHPSGVYFIKLFGDKKTGTYKFTRAN